MEFEFDDKKSKANKKKHGIDFIEAQQIWGDQALNEFTVVVVGIRSGLLFFFDVSSHRPSPPFSREEYFSTLLSIASCKRPFSIFMTWKSGLHLMCLAGQRLS